MSEQQERPCGGYHALPCGLDEQCPIDVGAFLPQHDLRCPDCEEVPISRHCKLVCSACGQVIADCGDPFR
jgi:hypothetical protein